jgi:glutamate synthase domain-containing protein 1
MRRPVAVLVWLCSIDGKSSRAVVENGIAALKAIWHRGAVDADGKPVTRVFTQIPVAFFMIKWNASGIFRVRTKCSP